MPVLSQPQAAPRLQRTQGAAHLSFGAAGVRRWREDGAAKLRLPHQAPGAAVEAILINTAGGLTGGDRLDWTLEIEGTPLVATTQAAEKIYRSLGSDAEIHTRIRGSSGAKTCWLPQEAILFDGARLRRTLEVDLESGASLLALEAIVLGRRSMGESIRDLTFHDRWRVRRDGALIFADDLRFGGPLPRGAAALGKAGAIATLLLVVPDAETSLDRVREVLGPAGAASAWNGKLLARITAQDGFELRRLLIPALRLLAPEQTLPAIWSF